MKKRIDVCLTPELLHLYELESKIVVIVDILRATSCMTTAFAHGVKEIIPVATAEECMAVKQRHGCLAAAERDGRQIDGYDFGNSPLAYLNGVLEGKTLVMTTTNGTKAISMAQNALEVIIGSFLNKEAVAQYLRAGRSDVLIVCAGWKGKVNLEDTLYAGALAEALTNDFLPADDSGMAAKELYKVAKSNMGAFLKDSSHFKRLQNLGIDRDIDFCLQENMYDVVPVLVNGVLVKYSAEVRSAS